MTSFSESHWQESEVRCRLCLKTLEEFGGCVEITENVEISIHEIFPLDLISFKSNSTLICDECMENVETCSSFRSSIIDKHQKLAEELQSLNVVKIECDRTDMSAVVIKTEIKFESEYFNDSAGFVDDYTEFEEPAPLKKQKGKRNKNKSCDICSFTTSSQNYFEYHQMEHAKIESQCVVCKKSLPSQHDLRMHTRQVHGTEKTDFKCSLCRFVSKAPIDLFNHGENHVKCETCEKSFDDRCQLLMHRKRYHRLAMTTSEKNEIKLRLSKSKARSDPDETVTCEICCKSVLFKRFNSHRRTHSEAQFECDRCGLKFRQRNKISDHMARQHGNLFSNQENSMGKGRIRKFYTLNDLATAKEALKSGGMTLCQAARAFNIPRRTLSDHAKGKRKSNFEHRQRLSNLEEAELADWVVTCAAKGCPRNRDQVMKAAYKILKRKASKKSIAPFTMSWLSQFLKRNPNVNLSKSSNIRVGAHNDFNVPKTVDGHETQGEVECVTCSKVFGSRDQLLLHRKQDHPLALMTREILEIEILEETLQDPEELMTCEICGELVIFKEFQVHKQAHDAHRLKTFICEIGGCEKRYSSKHQLKLHNKTAHLNQRDHKCLINGCDKAYTSNNKLKDHVKLKHENFRQKCPINVCTFHVGRRDYMRNHLKKHTELTTSEMNDMQEIVKNMKLVH